MTGLEYIIQNFTISGEAGRLLDNILRYVETLPKDNREHALMQLLDGTIGLTEEEIRNLANEEETA